MSVLAVPNNSYVLLPCCSKYLRRPVVVNIGTAGKATDNVTQRVVVSVHCLRAGPRAALAH